MSTVAIVMMVFGLGLTWGGAAACLRRAIRR
ncbi:MetS family NSS transporter small subunit [Paucidesulfovibrio gracilis]|nr:MetS family NSS transporter small subunit [Paucidesulfovibrio gracilis]